MPRVVDVGMSYILTAVKNGVKHGTKSAMFAAPQVTSVKSAVKRNCSAVMIRLPPGTLTFERLEAYGFGMCVSPHQTVKHLKRSLASLVPMYLYVVTTCSTSPLTPLLRQLRLAYANYASSTLVSTTCLPTKVKCR